MMEKQCGFSCFTTALMHRLSKIQEITASFKFDVICCMFTSSHKPQCTVSIKVVKN